MRRHNNGARYLAVIIAAQREIARLECLYDEIASQPPVSAEIIITRRPDGPENIPPPRPDGRPYAPSYISGDPDDDLDENLDENPDDSECPDNHDQLRHYPHL